MVPIDPNASPEDALDTNRAFGQGENRDDDPLDIAGSLEEALWHAPVIMRVRVVRKLTFIAYAYGVYSLYYPLIADSH